MKRAVALAALLALILCLSASAAFSDVPDTAWYAPAVNAMADTGRIKGYPDGTFGPEREVSRGEFAALAARWTAGERPAAAGEYWCAATLKSMTESLPPRWRDLPLDAAHFELPITREEAVYLLVALGGGDAGEQDAGAPITDLDAMDPALVPAVLTAYGQGLATGYPGGAFGPKDHLTRAQAAVLIRRWAPSCTAELTAVNTWDSGGERFTQYDLTVTALADTTSWQVRLTGDAEIRQSWSCETGRTAGETWVGPVDYNRAIPAGGAVTVGFIAAGGPLSLRFSGGAAAPAEEKPAPAPAAEVSVPVGEAKPLRVEGTHLADPDGNLVQLRGVSTHGLAWFPQYVSEESFRTLRDDWGVNVVRLAMYTAEYGGYCSGGDREELKAIIHKGVQAAGKLGMYVIIDWHILSDGNPAAHQAEAVEFFSELSARYAGCDHVLYELCNEPQNSPWQTVIKPYAETVLAAIRQNDPDAIVIVGTNTWSQDVDQVAGHRLDDPNVVYAFHFYAATHKDPYRRKVEAALDAGVPVFVSECGFCDASGDGGVDEPSAQAWVDLLNSRGVSFVAWSLCNKAEAASLIRAGCAKLSGWTEADLTQSGRLFRGAIRGE